MSSVRSGLPKAILRVLFSFQIIFCVIHIGWVYERTRKIKKNCTKLRAPDGCPWDESKLMSHYPIFEEANEVADTILSKDMQHLREELGDLLLQIMLHSLMAEEKNIFTLEDVINDLSAKLVRRHPHVFGEAEAANEQEVNILWEQIKKEERKKNKQHSLLDKVPLHFNALLKSFKYQKEASKVGFDWDDLEGPFAKIDEELQEIKEACTEGQQHEIEHEVGDLLFAVINLARKLKISPEVALTKCNKRFYERFSLVEKQVLDSKKKFEDGGNLIC